MRRQTTRIRSWLRGAAAAALLVVLAVPSAARAADGPAPFPGSPDEPPAAPADEPLKARLLPDWFALDAEYRVRSLVIDPLELNGTLAEKVTWTEQRLRIEPGIVLAGVGALFTQFDLLDGVLFGDNGDFGTDPEPAFGLAVTSRWPNDASWKVGLVEGGDALDPDSYGPVLTGVDVIQLNRVWGEVYLPFGLLRIGRQPATTGAGISLNDGARTNRWGVSRYSNTADRFLFATKISEAVRMIAEKDGYVPDRSMDDGVFLGIAYDMAVQDEVSATFDDLHQVATIVQWKERRPDWFGWDWDSLELQVGFAARFSDEFGTEVYAVPLELEFTVGPLHFLGEFALYAGHTREVSEGLAALRQADPARRIIRDQDILMMGARVITDLTFGPVTATLEFDYASGDGDPRDETALTTFNFAHDTNVGLLLFEHVLAFETARSVGVGIQSLRDLDANSFPITELASEGRFHNGIVLFPQVLVKPVDTLGIRVGALFAWSAADVIDPIMTLINEDGDEIADDAVNWNGGKPARYYGTEIDLQIEWTWRDFFIWTVEGAVLFPGDALKDESGDAVVSYLVENRFTFAF